MDLRFSSAALSTLDADLLVVAITQDLDLSELEASFDGHLAAWLSSQQFDGKAGSALLVPSFGRISASALCLVGVGKRTPEELHTAAVAAGSRARKHGACALALAFGSLSDSTLSAVLEGLAAGNYVYDRHQPESKRKAEINSITILGDPAGDAALAHARALSNRQRFARDLVNAPADELDPAGLAAAAKSLASIPHVTVEVWQGQRLKDEDCIGILAVGRGSSRPGCLIHVAYHPPGASEHIALVGKGVTFDSGGLSLKPSGSMLTMRCDMGGAATVLGAVAAVAELAVPVAVDCFVPAVENLTGPDAYKLGDILRYPNGVTVEVHNTDAEGRLVLADALLQACKVPGVTTVVDVATLTGACVVALGPELTGLFTADDALAAELSGAAEATHEPLWRLPLRASYKKSIKGDYGQIKNVGGREGGAITAALFLEHFVHGVRWAHLDIAASAFYDKARGPWTAGATGHGVRMLAHWIAAQAS